MSDQNTNVVIYSASWCAFCHMAKQYLSQLKVPFTEIDVEENHEAARELVEKTGQAGIPVIEIANETIIGFDRSRIDLALRANKLV
jgi:glutaredoxin 3